MTSPNILAVVPARGGSKGIVGKNLAMCTGKPLIEWTANAVRDSALVSYAHLSSDDDDIQTAWRHANWNGGVSHGSYCAPIPDDAQIEDRLGEIIENYDPNIIVLLQPTSPVRTGKQIDEAIEQLQREGSDSLVSVVESHAFMWEPVGTGRGGASFYPPEYQPSLKRPRRQDLQSHYEENGSIYVFTRDHWNRTHNRLGGKISLYVMPEESRVQVDTPFDLWMAEQILERQRVPA
jgi:CMP-N,N'-diacetyllegionaminic acid synthase